MRLGWLALGVVACNSFNYHTHEFIAGTACGQGPYDVHLSADGTTAEDGVEVIACTPRRIAGHVELVMGGLHDSTTFGSDADNQRCVGGGVVTATASGSSGSSSAAASGGGSGVVAAPVLIEQPYGGTESAFDEDLCKAFGLTEQEILSPETLRHDIGDAPMKGTDMHVRIWSDVPNDLSGVIFMVRQLTSTHAPAKPEPVEHIETHDDVVVSSKPLPPSHGAPPSPLAEQKPARTNDSAVWVPGYWTWTGTEWGWNAGFWRDGDTPAPRVEMPGASPNLGAIWIGGNWQRQHGSWVWIAGRWRAR